MSYGTRVLPGFHDRLMIASVAAADRAQFLISQCATFLTVAHILLGFQNRAGQVPDLFFRHIDDMKCKSLRRFTSDSGKF